MIPKDRSSSSSNSKTPPPPPGLLITWGSFSFAGIMESLG